MFWIDFEIEIANWLVGYPSWVVYIAINFVHVFVDGNLSVNVFWILSAYVITIKLFDHKGHLEEDTLLYFAFKRYFRLFIPCLGSILFAYLLLRFHLLYFEPLASKLGKGYTDGWLNHFYHFKPNLGSAIRSAFWDTFFEFNLKTSYNNPLWSIYYEFYGSLFVFGLYGILQKTEKRYIMYILCLLIAYFVKLSWPICFLMGMVLSDFTFSEKNRYQKIYAEKLFVFLNKHAFLFISLLVLSLIFGRSILYRMGAFPEIINAILGFIVIFGVLHLRGLQNFFERSLFRWLGKISFSLYLLHVPFFFSFTSWFYLQMPTLSHAKAAVLSCSVTIVILFFISYLYSISVNRFSIIFSNQIGQYVRNSKKNKQSMDTF